MVMQALFGIIQGGSFRDLREQSTKFILIRISMALPLAVK